MLNFKLKVNKRPHVVRLIHGTDVFDLPQGSFVKVVEPSPIHVGDILVRTDESEFPLATFYSHGITVGFLFGRGLDGFVFETIDVKMELEEIDSE